MRGQDHVVEFTQRADEFVVVALGLFREHVDGRAQQVTVFQGRRQGVDIHHLAAGVVDQVALGLHGTDLLFLDHPASVGGVRHVQADHIAHAQQLGEAAHLLGISQRQLGNHVVELHLHAHGLGQYGHLGADIAVTHQTQGLAPDFIAVLGRLEPAAAVGRGVLLGNAAHQVDGMGNHQFRHGTGIGIGGIEYRDTTLQGSIEVYLVGTDTETTHADQLLRCLEHLFGELGAGTDANEMGVLDLVCQVVAGQRSGQQLHVAVAVRLQVLHGVFVDALEQENADLVLLKRSIGHD